MEKPNFIREPLLGLTQVTGGNFTGRTDTLREFTGLRPSLHEEASVDAEKVKPVYVGPEVYNALSGLAETSAEELRLHDPRYQSNPMWKAIDAHARLGPILSSNPFHLSGGQQSLLVVIAGLLVAGERMAIDTALEQLDEDARAGFLSQLRDVSKERIAIGVADNRLEAIRGWCDQKTRPIRKARRHQTRSFQHMRIAPEGVRDLPRSEQADVTIEGVSFQYAATGFTLTDISCRLERGITYSLCGANGAGKTTLSKLLAGVIRPQAGAVRVGLRNYALWRAPGTVFAYHFQNPDVQLFESTVEREVQLSCARGPNKNVVEMLLQIFALDDVRGEHPLDLPFALRKRVALAAAIAQPTPWVILDEPTLGQDDEVVAALEQLVASLNSIGRGVILISHSSAFLGKTQAVPLTMEGGRLVEGSSSR